MKSRITAASFRSGGMRVSGRDRFLEKYRELENLARTEYDLEESDSPIAHLSRINAFRDIRDDLDLCRKVRNLLIHERRILGADAVEPGEEMIALLDETLRRVRRPLRATDIAVGIERVHWRSLGDPVLPAVRIMNEKRISHIPILRNGVVEGVFSDSTVMACLLDGEAAKITGGRRFSDLEKYLPLDAHRADSFRFVAGDAPVADIADIFADALTKSERIGLVFVTASGRSSERLLGIITSWDLAGSARE